MVYESMNYIFFYGYFQIVCGQLAQKLLKTPAIKLWGKVLMHIIYSNKSTRTEETFTIIYSCMLIKQINLI